MVTFRVTDSEGATLCDQQGRDLSFSGPNGFRDACHASRPSGRRRPGPFQRDAQGAFAPYRGEVYIEASAPLEPSGESRWQVLADGSYAPV